MWRSDWKLKADIARWQDAGWVTQAGASAIAAEIGAVRRGPGAAAAMGLLGAILFGFAAMSFVAANWQAIPRIARVALLVAAMGGSYAGAGMLFQRGRDAFAHAAVLAGAALFGANIMLIGQMYHMDGSLGQAVLVWALGALAAGVAARSNPALLLSLLLMCFWGLEETRQLDLAHSRADARVFWPFLLGWAAVAGGMAVQRWQRGLELAALALSAWIISFGSFLPGAHAHHLIVPVGAAMIAAGLWLAKDANRPELSQAASDTLIFNGALIAGISLYIAQFEHADELGSFGLWAALALAATIAAIWGGLQTGRTGMVRLGYTAFSIEILTIYFETVGSLLGSAAFFLIAGLILVTLAAIAIRFEKTSGATS